MMAAEKARDQSVSHEEELARYKAWVDKDPEMQKRLANARESIKNGSSEDGLIIADQLQVWLDEAGSGKPVRP